MARQTDDPRTIVIIPSGPFASVNSVTVDGYTYANDELVAAQFALLTHIVRRLEALEKDIQELKESQGK